MKKWLITGASSGFGRLLAERVATDGDHVIAVARREDRLRELAADHGSVTPLVIDLTTPDVEQRLGTAIPDSEARAVFDTNFFAPLAVLRAALPSLRRNRGKVVQLSSMLGEVAWLGSGVYSASKAAIEMAMEGLALELAPIGVNVTIVAPGIMATDFAATSHRVQPDETYGPTVGAFFREFAAQPREAFGEPSSVVEAILTAVAAAKPPLRIAVGTDAVRDIQASLTSRLSELERWSLVSK
ncbi:MAG TPA: SDR family NAD(P)-dependent oxidoreductase [Solirubrobacteraceae bacterium]|nr:SDR family NAD(P)-dependent oxidoreductase [Solirubrobacteraceae bacterium]